MELIIDAGVTIINADVIQAGDLIRAKYSGWEEARNGQVTVVSDKEIRVIWQPGIRNVTNFFVITAEELEAGLWTVTWSPDLETIYTTEQTGDDGGGGE